MKNDVEKMREIQRKNLTGFELIFNEHIDFDLLRKTLTNSKHYWMQCVEGDFRYHGVELPSFDVMYISFGEQDGTQVAYIAVPTPYGVDSIVRFADRFNCDIFFNGEKLYQSKKDD